MQENESLTILFNFGSIIFSFLKKKVYSTYSRRFIAQRDIAFERGDLKTYLTNLEFHLVSENQIGFVLELYSFKVSTS